MFWFQTESKFRASGRGLYLITDELYSKVPEIRKLVVGTIHLFIKHTSASLTVNENADPTVREDFEAHLNHIVPEDMPYYKHTYEGPDDMPAHIKSSLIGPDLTLPIKDGKICLGTWQGIYLFEHRDIPKERTIVVTLNGRDKIVKNN